MDTFQVGYQWRRGRGAREAIGPNVKNLSTKVGIIPTIIVISNSVTNSKPYLLEILVLGLP